MEYRKISNISPELVDIFKHILGGFYSGEVWGRLIFGGNFVLVYAYKDLNLSKSIRSWSFMTEQ